MNKFHFLSLFFLALGIVFLFLGFLFGDVKAGFIFILPFISGSGIFAFLGFIFIIASIFLYLFGFTSIIQNDSYNNEESEIKPRKKTSLKSGAVVLIGPIPIVFGNSIKLVIISIILTIFLIIVSFFIFWS
ncbi:MAG: hypothetical protein AYK22_08055 [Thermoplasmatales archaeon SG8-52-3]|nr:MAG: hypothetical protein AYK22_08055 [Thermoplasmatales archaeon SG8-52-3]